jgi:DedD protein
MDQGLKERLVGAAVLVAIGVWLIPWVLDGPENPPDAGANSLQLPAVEEPMPMRTQTLRLGEADEPAAETPPRATPAPAESTAATTAASEDPPAREAPRDAEPPAATSAPAPVAVATAPPPKPTPAAAAGGDWIVQLGTFSEEANARRLAQRASTFGYEPVVSNYRANGRTLYRVRVGPATTRAQADTKASALRAHGINEASVVAAH